MFQSSKIDLMFLFLMIGIPAIAYSVFTLALAVKRYAKLIDEANSQIREFVLMSLAYKASKDIHPMAGPAALQQLSKLRNNEPVVPEEKKEPEKKTGVTIRQGVS